MAVYELPELDYAYDALEPHISAEIMELHHTKHHANYVAGANAALEAIDAEIKGEGNADRLRALYKNLALTVAASQPASWQRLSTVTSVPSRLSRRPSTLRLLACRAPAGLSWATTTSLAASSFSS